MEQEELIKRIEELKNNIKDYKSHANDIDKIYNAIINIAPNYENIYNFFIKQPFIYKKAQEIYKLKQLPEEKEQPTATQLVIIDNYFCDATGQTEQAKKEEIKEIKENQQPSPEETIINTLNIKPTKDILTKMLEDAKTGKTEKPVKTPFKALNDKLNGGLYSGLYFIGAESGTGKTTFILQLADYLAEHSNKVLFMGIEQAAEQLLSKSISRLSYNLNNKAAATDRQHYNNYEELKQNQKDNIEQAYKYYIDNISNNINFIEQQKFFNTSGNLTPYNDYFDIIETAIKKCLASGNKPILFIDYLQLLGVFNTGNSGTDKQRIEQVIMKLKQIQVEYKIIIICVSSVNRDAYKESGTAADKQKHLTLKALKESGAIEYTADIVILMEKVNEKGKIANIYFNIAKNRYGKQAELELKFYKEYSTFENIGN